MSTIIGITSGSESGVCIYYNGKIIFAINEERLSRLKNDHSYPKKSIAYIKKHFSKELKNIEKICFGFTTAAIGNKFAKNTLTRLLKYKDIDKNSYQIIIDRLRTEIEIDSAKLETFKRNISFDFPKVDVFYTDHHNSHTYCAIAASGFIDTDVLTADGRGDFTSTLFGRFRPNEGFKECYRSSSWESLGYFYGRITHLCGFTPNKHEGKIVGLSATGDPKKALELMRSMIDVHEGEIISFVGDMYRPFFTNFSDNLIKQIKKFSIQDIAAAAQFHLEDMVLKLLEFHHSGSMNISLAGGIFANVRLNQKIRECGIYKNVYVYPNMGDGGIANGAVYFYINDIKKEVNLPVSDLYLGHNLSEDKLAKTALANDLTLTKPSKIEDELLERLYKNQICGLVQNKMEFGPRSLGNRSIVLRPDNEEMIIELNNRLGRNEFMPFAPSIPENLANKSLLNYSSKDISADFMTMTYYATEWFRESCGAVVHVDNTIRPQIVKESQNPFFYKILNKWFEKYNIPCLINTSFNLHEEPIVCSEEDIICSFKKNAVDFITNGKILIHK